MADLAHDAFLPRAPGGLGPGAAISLVVHGGLIAALALAVDWRLQTPEVVSAELWAAVPQVAPPPAPTPTPVPTPVPEATTTPPAPAPAPAPPQLAAPPPPKPPEAQIATERADTPKTPEKNDKADKAKTAREKRAEALAEKKRLVEDKKQAANEKKRLLAEQKREAEEAAAQEAANKRFREEQLRRMQAALPAATGTGAATATASSEAAPSQAYVAKLVKLIRQNVKVSVSGNPEAEVEVRAAAGGTIIARRLVKPSGNAAWDDAVLRAIDRTATLPRDENGRVPTVLLVVFRPQE